MSGTEGVPAIRLRAVTDGPVRRTRAFVLYWMTAFRRVDWNFALERAVALARELGRPLVILETLDVSYPWASNRFHRFALEGMAERARRLRGARVLYHPYVEREAGAAAELVAALAGEACLVVTDDFPVSFAVRRLEEAVGALDVRVEAVDSNGLLPLRATERAWSRAYDFRGLLQRELPAHLSRFPSLHPLRGDPLPALEGLPEAIAGRWLASEVAEGGADAVDLSALPVDHAVEPVAYRGGPVAARFRLASFLDDELERYAAEASDPGADVASGLSPWLHFGHLSAHEVFRAVAERESWNPGRLSEDVAGAREWGTVGDGRGGRGLPGPARHLEGAGIQHVCSPPGLRRLRVPAGLGPRDAGGPRRGRAPTSLFAG